MTRHSPIKPVTLSPLGGDTGAAGGSPAAASATLITADARTVSPRGFLEALGLSSPELREARRERDRQACIRAIRRGDPYGFPPSLVAECKAIMAEGDVPDTGWALAERSAFGMPGVGA